LSTGLQRQGDQGIETERGKVVNQAIGRQGDKGMDTERGKVVNRTIETG
jgi:hypothetical protein